MDLEKIKVAIESGQPKALIRMVVLDIISQDENALIDMMELLRNERKRKKELLSEMNLQLSRAHVGLQAPNLDIPFIIEEVNKFYEIHKDQVGHCFQDLSQKKLHHPNT